MKDCLIISRGKLQKGQLSKTVCLVTGGGGGIGFETARALLWLGARVIIAEVDKALGKQAESRLTQEFGQGMALFVHTDISKERSVSRLKRIAMKAYGRVDVIINNATVAPMGAAHQVSVRKWDFSYGVNLRGPVLLLSEFLPQMLERNSGVIVFVPSSGAAPYMGAYEVFKTSQVELSNTLAGELENTKVITYSIGPGIVKTNTAHKAIQEIAPLYGKSVDEFYKMNEAVLLSAEEAGAGFAASVALADRYRGLETSSIQALTDAGITLSEPSSGKPLLLPDQSWEPFIKAFENIKATFEEQSEGWSKRPVFERQWILRDFKKYTGAAPEYFLEKHRDFYAKANRQQLQLEDIENLQLEKLRVYYEHQIDLLRGYEKDQNKVREFTAAMNQWIDAIRQFEVLVETTLEIEL